MQYRINEGALTLADPWQDQSINVLLPGRASTPGVNMVIARDTLPLGMAFADYVAQQRQTFQAQLPDLAIAADTTGEIDGHPAQFLDLSWRNDGKPVHQLMAMVVHEGDKVLNFTCSLPERDADGIRQEMIDALMSFKFGP
ncbi:DcrB-related protein [Sphingomonas bacterium]|uniref:DcrB-related protein n=1 Tax=Sphingomonas bacterium TaxID=1895847 RepID=UPI001574FC64|nr:DUF1795 domain-containing protein [Sphingomonas bacterium]